MKILHICLGNPFTEEMAYKETYIVRANLQDGHDVLMIAPTLKWDKGRIVETPEENKIIYGGVKLIRLNYDNVINKRISDKIRKSNRIFNIIEEYTPNVIVFQCIQSYSVQFIKKLKRVNPGVKIYGDISTTYENSAQTLLSKKILHGIIYKHWIKKAEPYFDKLFYVTPESKMFVMQMYGVSEEKLEWNPLCGQLTTSRRKEKLKKEYWQEHNLTEKNIIFIHSGKMNKLKQTLEVLQEFNNFKNENFRLLIAGSFSDDIITEAEKIIKLDKRITYLGFLKADELEKYLNIADLYIQPGSPSQTANTAICCFTPVVLADIPTYSFFMEDNGWLINSTRELGNIFTTISNEPHILKHMSKNAEKLATEKLDYRVLAARLYS